MESAIQVRPAVDADLPAILNLYAHLNPEDPALEISHAQAVWTEILKSNRVTPLVATAGRAPVATCLLVIVPNLTRGGRPFGLIENVVTVPRFRRRGIGTFILKHAVELAWSANCYKVVLTTRRASDELFAFYEKTGFERATRTAFEIRRD